AIHLSHHVIEVFDGFTSVDAGELFGFGRLDLPAMSDTHACEGSIFLPFAGIDERSPQSDQMRIGGDVQAAHAEVFATTPAFAGLGRCQRSAGRQSRRLDKTAASDFGPYIHTSPIGVLVAPGPIDALPSGRFQGTDEQQPARLDQGGLQVLGPMLAEVAERHAPRDLYPMPAEIGLLENSCLAFDE